LGNGLTLDNTIYILYINNMTAREIINKLKAYGWTLDRINGSHHVFVKTGRRPVSVPFHGNKDIGHLAKRILKEAGVE
jgi:predicted RNA binding protein YcfA (HicA-like mRNA interferase family)